MEWKNYYKKDWHEWFAWYPIIIETKDQNNGEYERKVWLNKVLRKYTNKYWQGQSYWVYEYREIGKERKEWKKTIII